VTVAEEPITKTETKDGTGAERPRGREESRRRELVGVVTSDKMQNTRVVIVERRLSHDKYGKFMTARKKFKAHDEKNEYKVGDRVLIVESRPLSRDKRWRVEKLIERPQEA
jgi:small subunit ribosomal protein S17